MLGCFAFLVPHGDLSRVPRHITAALLEARYGRYLDQAESLTKVQPREERLDGDRALHEVLERDSAVLLLNSAGAQSPFTYQKSGESSAGFGCVGTSDPRQAGVLRCRINGDLFGERGLRYQRDANKADGANIMLDFRIVNDTQLAGSE